MKSFFAIKVCKVAELLYATDLQLTDWDIKLLLTTAEEDSVGRIEYKPSAFVFLGREHSSWFRGVVGSKARSMDVRCVTVVNFNAAVLRLT